MATTLQGKIRSWARAHAAVHRSNDIATRENLVHAATLFTRQPLNYDSYCLVRDQLPPKISRLLTASLFARVSAQDPYLQWPAFSFTPGWFLLCTLAGFPLTSIPRSPYAPKTLPPSLSPRCRFLGCSFPGVPTT
jgi:hypothetical protein